MSIKYSRAEKALIRELEAKIDAANSEAAKGQFRAQLQRVRDEARSRAKSQEEESVALRPADFPTEEHYIMARKELAARQVLDRSTSLRALKDAENTLKNVARRKQEMAAEPPAEDRPDITESERDLARLSDERLVEEFFKQKSLPGIIGAEPDTALIAALAQEIDRRDIPKVSRIVNTNHFVDHHGRPFRDFTRPHLRMGDIEVPAKG